MSTQTLTDRSIKEICMKTEQTVDIILKNAKSLFLTKGFAGTSMSDIAKSAEIGKSLIYHYFESKTHLWKSVKQSILNNHINKNAVSQITNLDFKNFIKKLVILRFDFYFKNPDIIKMIALQRIEKGSPVLSMSDSNWYNDIRTKVSEFQTHGYINKKIDPDFATYFILSSTTNLFFDLSNKIIKENSGFYIDQITTLIVKALENISNQS